MKFAFAIILTVASAAAFSPSVSRPPSSPRRPLTRRTSGDGTVLNTCFDKSREAFSAEHQHAPIDASFLQNGMEQFVGELRHNQHSSILFEEEDEDFLLLLEDSLDSDEEDYSVIEIEDIFIDELGNIVEEDSNSKRMLIHARYSEKSSRNWPMLLVHDCLASTTVLTPLKYWCHQNVHFKIIPMCMTQIHDKISCLIQKENLACEEEEPTPPHVLHSIVYTRRSKPGKACIHWYVQRRIL